MIALDLVEAIAVIDHDAVRGGEPFLRQVGGPVDPFELGAAYFNEVIRSGAGPGLTRLMRHIWASRPDLQQHFPEADGRDSADFTYKVTDYYAPEHDRCIRWDDPEIGIRWPLQGNPVLSAKDAAGLPLSEAEVYL